MVASLGNAAPMLRFGGGRVIPGAKEAQIRALETLKGKAPAWYAEDGGVPVVDASNYVLSVGKGTGFATLLRDQGGAWWHRPYPKTWISTVASDSVAADEPHHHHHHHREHHQSHPDDSQHVDSSAKPLLPLHVNPQRNPQQPNQQLVWRVQVAVLHLRGDACLLLKGHPQDGSPERPIHLDDGAWYRAVATTQGFEAASTALLSHTRVAKWPPPSPNQSLTSLKETCSLRHAFEE